MAKRFLVLVLVATLALPALAAEKPQPPPPPLKLKAGDQAPEFSLLAFDGKELKKYSLADFRGKKNVVLAFFVFAFTPG